MKRTSLPAMVVALFAVGLSADDAQVRVEVARATSSAEAQPIVQVIRMNRGGMTGTISEPSLPPGMKAGGKMRLGKNSGGQTPEIREAVPEPGFKFVSVDLVIAYTGEEPLTVKSTDCALVQSDGSSVAGLLWVDSAYLAMETTHKLTSGSTPWKLLYALREDALAQLGVRCVNSPTVPFTLTAK